MKIYHGSDVVVKNPEILQSNRLLDFGVGFYTTSNREQAARWAEKVSLRNNSGEKFLSIYNYDKEEAIDELKIIEFEYADDNVYLTVKLFETGVLDRKEAVKRLKIEKLFN